MRICSKLLKKYRIQFQKLNAQAQNQSQAKNVLFLGGWEEGTSANEIERQIGYSKIFE